MNCLASRSLTRPPKRNGSADPSASGSQSTPLFPATSASQNASQPTPSGETTPRPVMTAWRGEGMGKGSGDRGQETGDRGQGSEVRSQGSEVRSQGSEVRSQRSEVSRQFNVN